jgi:hypothetical protein
MICSSCQKEIPSDSTYCPYCGELYNEQREAKEIKIKGLTHISGVPGFKNEGITINFRDKELLFSPILSFGPPKNYSISQNEIKRVLLYGGKGTIVLQMDTGEIVLKGNVDKFASAIKQIQGIVLEKIGAEAPLRPTWLTVLGIIWVIGNCIAIILSFVLMFTPKLEVWGVSSLLSGGIGLFVTIKLLKGKKWAWYATQAIFALNILLVWVYCLIELELTTFIRSLVPTIVWGLFLWYLNTKRVREYFGISNL